MTINGDRLLVQLAALASPQRLRIIASLNASGRNYISRLARELQIGRPVLHLHLSKLEQAGLVRSQLELSEDGKALNYFELTDFALKLDPGSISNAVLSLSKSVKIES